MANTIYTFQVRSAGTPQAGLEPGWVDLFKLSDGTNIPTPTTTAPIVELGSGIYKVTYDPEVHGEAAGLINCGESIESDAERYVCLTLASDSSLIASRASQTSITTLQASVDALPAPALTADQATLLDRIAGAAGVGLGESSDSGWQQVTGSSAVVRTFPLPSGGTMTQTATKSGSTITIVVAYEE